MKDDANIYIKLGDVATVGAGYPLRSSAEALEIGDINYVQLKNTNNYGGIDWGDVVSVSLPTKREPRWLQGGDIIFAARGTRTLAFLIESVPGKAVCAPHFFVVSVSAYEKLMPEFLTWQINQKPAQDYFQKNATGAHILNIRRKALENLPIAIPSKSKQRAIVEFWRAALREQVLMAELMNNRKNQFEALASGLLQNNEEA